jgi:hypothetical protein
VYLQQLRSDGTHVKPPLFMTRNPNEGDLRIVPKIAIGSAQTLVGRTHGHSNVNSLGFFQVETVVENGITKYFERDSVNKYSFQGRNFSWQPPKVTSSLDVEYFVTRTFSVVGSANYSSSSSRGFLGIAAGVGFSFESRNLGVRIDLGGHWSSVSYDVDYAIATKVAGQPGRQVEFFHESGKSSYLNSYGAFTINTKINSWPIQAFLQLGINRQTLVDIERQTTISARSLVLQSSSFFILTPGFFLDLTRQTRIVAGVHLSDETELLEADPGVLVVPFVQFEFGLQ